MRRLLAIAALLAGLILPSTLHAQYRGGARFAAPRAAPRMGGGFSGFRSAPSPVRSGAFRSGPMRPAPFGARARGPRAFSGRPARPTGFHGHGHPGPFPRGRFFPHRRFFQSSFFPGFGYPYSYWYAFPPYYYSPIDDEGDNWSDQTSAAAAEPEQEQPEEQDDALAEQVQELTDEVTSLHARQAYGQAPRPPAAASQGTVEEKSVPAVFVYRDGHQLEAQNYAILGQTLWVFGNEMTRKVPLADLDIAQTRKLNDERGIDFTPPELR